MKKADYSWYGNSKDAEPWDRPASLPHFLLLHPELMEPQVPNEGKRVMPVLLSFDGNYGAQKAPFISRYIVGWDMS